MDSVLSMPMQLAVIAKEPRPGFVKTRLCPPCTPEQAAEIAAAALGDTLAAVAATPARRRVLVLDGARGPWVPDVFDVIPQVGGGLGERLAAAFSHCFATSTDPVLLVGMDTPQVRPEHLRRARSALAGGADAVLGLAPDGGYWLIGLSHPHPEAFDGVPMSAVDTGRSQLAQLERCGYGVALCEELTDVDEASDAVEIARLLPTSSRFRIAVERALGPVGKPSGPVVLEGA